MGALKYLPTYISTLRTINTVIEVLDQEDDKLDDLYGNVEGVLRDLNIRYSLKSELERVRLYECSIGSRKFNLVIIVSGLDDTTSKSHNIEDHLSVKLGELEDESESMEINTKEKWRGLPRDVQFSILRVILNKLNNK